MNKMRALTLFPSILFSLPFAFSAQSAGEMLQRVSAVVDNKQWEQTISLFRQTVNTNMEKAEMFYWAGVDKNTDIAPRFASELTSFYEKPHSYDKTHLFYKRLLQKSPDDVGCLAFCDEMEACRGKEAGALRTYEKVLTLDADNLAVNISVGNYYYLKVEQGKQKIEDDYKKINTPARMQYACYREGLSQIFTTRYIKIKGYLEGVVSQFPSTEAKKTLDRIRLIEREVDRQ